MPEDRKKLNRKSAIQNKLVGSEEEADLVIISLPEKDQEEQTRLFKNAVTQYHKGSGYNFNLINKNQVIFNPENPPEQMAKEAIGAMDNNGNKNKPIIVMFEGHSEIYSDMNTYLDADGNTKQTDNKDLGIQNLSQLIKIMNKELKGRIKGAILETCNGAAELKPQPNSTTEEKEKLKKSPARKLSTGIGKDYNILAFNSPKNMQSDEVFLYQKVKQSKNK